MTRRRKRVKAQYPTKDEILDGEVKFRKETTAIMESWKDWVWDTAKDRGDDAKMRAIRALLSELAESYGKPEPKVDWIPEESNNGTYLDGVITLLGTPSIVTALHELAHHLFGAGEKQATRWSVWLFKRTFPKAFRRLKWKGHLVIPKNDAETTDTGDGTDGPAKGNGAETDEEIQEKLRLPKERHEQVQD